MSEQLLIAILMAASRVGFDAVASFLKNRGATIDSAIAALEVAATKSLQDYKDEDKAAALAAIGVAPTAPVSPDTTSPKVVAVISTP